jgi:hypothetical protein
MIWIGHAMIVFGAIQIIAAILLCLSWDPARIDSEPTGSSSPPVEPPSTRH